MLDFNRLILWGVSSLNVLIAQTSGDGGPSSLSIVTLVTQIGFSGIFLWQWHDERKERRATQADMAELFERLLPVLQEATTALERVQSSMERQVEAVDRRIPKSELTETIDRLQDLAATFEGRLSRRLPPDSSRGEGR